ncbi:hypothetical protein AHEVV1_003 [Adoxophyes honmai entomopoxvirus 'L' virophage 1]|nr:hypothetical protein AHEVV1_003 [Adoxophyes honmai entomopoxvirus 'L' virophage 1]
MNNNCQCNLKCICKICCFCSDKRIHTGIFKIYIDGYGELFLPSKEFKIPKYIDYCCINQKERTKIINLIKRKLINKNIKKYKDNKSYNRQNKSLQVLCLDKCKEIYNKDDINNLIKLLYIK